MNKKLTNHQFEAMLKELHIGCSFIYYSDITAQLERNLACLIRLCPMENRALVTNDAALITRVLYIKTKPGEGVGEVYVPRHSILFDKTLPPVTAARLVAHDIFPIWVHRPEDPCWDDHMDEKTGCVIYGPDREKDADKFSLRLLKEHPFRVGFTPPTSAKDFIQMLDDASHSGKFPAWPDYMTRDEAIAYITKLYEN